MDPNTTTAPEVEHIAPDSPAPQVDPALGDWYKSSAPGPDSEHAAPGSPAPQVDAQPQQPQTVPVAVTPLKRGGLLGVIDSVADALVGKSRPELGKDPDGNMYIKQHSLTKGEQWMRIAGEGIVGAAAGLKAGRGHGAGAAGVAGIQAGQQLQDREKQGLNDEIGQDDKLMMSNANRQMLRMNFAENAWKSARLQVEATQHDIEFSQKQEDRLVKDSGGVVLGNVSNPSEISGILKVNPDLAKDMVENHQIELVKHYDENGKVAGFKVIKMPNTDYRHQMLAPGALFHTFDPVSHSIVEHHASDPMSAGDRDDYDLSASNELTKWQNARTENQLKDAQAHLATAQEGAVPSKVNLNTAQANKANADASLARAQTQAGGGPVGTAAVAQPTGIPAVDDELSKWPPAVQAAVRGVPAYTTDPATFPTRKTAKGNEMTRETAIGLAHMIDPSFKEALWSSRKKAITEWSDPQKAGGTLISLNQAIQHLGELRKGIDGLHNSHFWLWNKGVNLAKEANDNPAIAAFDTPKQGVMNEMAAVFKKTSGTDQEIKAWGHTMDRATGRNNQNKSASEMLELMVGRVDAMHDQYRRAMGRDPDQPFIGPQAAAALLAMGPAGKKLVDRDRAQVWHSPAAPAAAAPAAPAASGEPPIEQPVASGRAFSKGAWLQAHPGGDVNAATQEAQRQGHPVID